MGGPGMIFSAETLRRTAPHISYCLQHLLTKHEDVELGRCIRMFAGVSCTWNYEVIIIFGAPMFRLLLDRHVLFAPTPNVNYTRPESLYVLLTLFIRYLHSHQVILMFSLFHCQLSAATVMLTCCGRWG